MYLENYTERKPESKPKLVINRAQADESRLMEEQGGGCVRQAHTTAWQCSSL